MIDLHKTVRDAYGQVASAACGTSSWCGACCARTNEITMAPDYSWISGYQKNADLWLWCGIPTWAANILDGDTVIDLWSGAGNDAFIVRRIVGESGKVIGVDMTPEMIALSRKNAAKLGYSNVEFLEARIGDITSHIRESTADVVVSNCVLNLLPDKERIFSDIYILLKEGGHLSVSDIVHVGEMPEGIKRAAELFTGCISGSIQREAYLGLMEKAGLKNIEIRKEQEIPLSDAFIREYLTEDEMREFRSSGYWIYSITVYAERQGSTSCHVRWVSGSKRSLMNDLF